MADVLCPDCPTCGWHPLTTWFVPYLCSNPECTTLSWDPAKSSAENLASTPVVIDLDDLDGTDRRG